jgi:hypothetical protein
VTSWVSGEISAPTTLPDFCLILLFGGASARGRESVQDYADRTLGPDVLASTDDVAHRLAARRLTAVDVTEATRDDLKRMSRAAVGAYARLYAIALEDADVDLVARRLGTISIKELTAVPLGHAAPVTLRPVSTDRRGEHGPFDIIGDVHGCRDELLELLAKLGYRQTTPGGEIVPPPGRRAFFVGDLVDRGPDSPGVLRLVMGMVAAGSALCVAGNHDVGLKRWIDGEATSLKHGLETTVAQFARETPEFKDEVRAFLASLQGHVWVDGGRLVVAHAGVKDEMIGRSSGRVRAFSLYGDTDSRTAADGLPVRYHWALDYRGEPAVVYGHTPLPEAAWVNNTLCIDTGCCFGGRLTALRWPERELVSVSARQTYAVAGRQFGHPPPRPSR